MRSRGTETRRGLARLRVRTFGRTFAERLPQARKVAAIRREGQHLTDLSATRERRVPRLPLPARSSSAGIARSAAVGGRRRVAPRGEIDKRDRIKEREGKGKGSFAHASLARRREDTSAVGESKCDRARLLISVPYPSHPPIEPAASEAESRLS